MRQTRLDIDLGALEFCPGIFQMIGRVDAPNDIGRQATFGLEFRESLERRRRQYAAEIPDHCFDHLYPPTQAADRRELTRTHQRGQHLKRGSD